MTVNLDFEMDHVKVEPVQPLIGAWISGIELRHATTKECAAIRAALLRHKVIFFRDQSLSRDEHVAFGKKFGELEIHPLAVHPDYPELLPITSEGGLHEGMTAPAADFWHSDTTFRELPSAASILQAYQLPALGGDTLWCNMVAVYNGLDDELKERIGSLYAIHNGAGSYAFRRMMEDKEKRAAFLERYPPQAHPVIRVHPETGEKLLYVNSGFTTHIVDMEEDESARLLAHLYDEVKRPEYQVRLRWEPGTIAFWDNRSTQHYGVADYTGKRHLERVTVVGNKPYGITER